MILNTKGSDGHTLQASAVCIPKQQAGCPGTIPNDFLCVFSHAHSWGYKVLWEQKETKMVRVFWLMSQIQGHVAREKSSHSHMVAERRHTCMVLASDVGWTSSHQVCQVADFQRNISFCG